MSVVRHTSSYDRHFLVIYLSYDRYMTNSRSYPCHMTGIYLNVIYLAYTLYIPGILLCCKICGASRADSAATYLGCQATDISAAFCVWRLPSGSVGCTASEQSSEGDRKYQDRQCQPPHSGTHTNTHALASACALAERVICHS